MSGLKPFWRYYGGKWRVAPRYPKPTHAHIVEPFVLIRPTGTPWTSYNDPPPELPPIEEPPPVRVMPPHYTLAPPPFERPAIMPAHTRCAAPRRATERRHRSSVRRFVRVCA